MKEQPVFQVGTEGGKETAMVELRCPQSPKDPGDHSFPHTSSRPTASRYSLHVDSYVFIHLAHS